MLLKTLTRSFVVKCFREFHQEVLLAKAMALSGQSINIVGSTQEATATVDIKENDDLAIPDTAPDKIGGVAASLLSKLEVILKNQMTYAISYGGDFASKYYLEAQYLMVAYADEVFLNLNWAGRREWESNLLESRMYNSHIAGQEFFRRLDKYLLERDPSTRDIGTVYLWILGLGFKGLYRNVDDKGVLKTYRRRLYEFVTLQQPDLKKQDTTLFAQCYEHTLGEGITSKLPNPRAYNMTFWGIIGVFIVGSFFVWLQEIEPLKHAMNEIMFAHSKGNS